MRDQPVYESWRDELKAQLSQYQRRHRELGERSKKVYSQLAEIDAEWHGIGLVCSALERAIATETRKPGDA